MYLGVSSLLESVMVLPYVSRCIRFVVFVCVYVCVCVCVCSDVLKNGIVPFALCIHIHKGV